MELAIAAAVAAGFGLGWFLKPEKEDSLLWFEAFSEGYAACVEDNEAVAVHRDGDRRIGED